MKAIRVDAADQGGLQMPNPVAEGAFQSANFQKFVDVRQQLFDDLSGLKQKFVANGDKHWEARVRDLQDKVKNATNPTALRESLQEAQRSQKALPWNERQTPQLLQLCVCGLKVVCPSMSLSSLPQPSEPANGQTTIAVCGAIECSQVIAPVVHQS